MEKLEKERVRQLLERADQKWFKDHSGEFKYQEHLDFTAEYLAKHYNSGNTKKGHDADERKRKGMRPLLAH